MTNPDTIREIQRLMDESRGAKRCADGHERRIAGLLGIDKAALGELPAQEVTGPPTLKPEP